MHRKPKFVAAAAAALAFAVGAASLIALPQKVEPISPPSVSAAAQPAKESAPARPVDGAKPVAGSTSGGTSEGDSVPPLEATVQQLKDAGNWNVLVLYASKWTRDQPDNAAAWKELSIGYANLHQFNDAAVAAEKAAELSPAEALLWRNVGHLNLTLERLPEAESAFDRALAISNDDADALCGAALVALEIRAERRRCDCAAGQVPRRLPRPERWRERDGRRARRRGKQARIVSPPLTRPALGRHAGLATPRYGALPLSDHVSQNW